MNVERIASQFAAEVPDVLKLDNDYNLLDDITRLGAYDVDWSGHYGHFIFFNLTAEDEPKVLSMVLKRIEQSFS